MMLDSRYQTSLLVRARCIGSLRKGSVATDWRTTAPILRRAARCGLVPAEMLAIAHLSFHAGHYLITEDIFKTLISRQCHSRDAHICSGL